jgi:hypothetical protein
MNRGNARSSGRCGARSIKLDAIQTAVAALSDLLQSGAGANARINHARWLGAELQKVADIFALGGRKRKMSEFETT